MFYWHICGLRRTQGRIVEKGAYMQSENLQIQKVGDEEAAKRRRDKRQDDRRRLRQEEQQEAAEAEARLRKTVLRLISKGQVGRARR